MIARTWRGAVRAADALEILRLHEVDARTNDVGERGAGLFERGADDLEAAACLTVGVLGRVGALGHHGGGAGHIDVLADTHGPREADDGLVRGAGGDEPALHVASIAKCPFR